MQRRALRSVPSKTHVAVGESMVWLVAASVASGRAGCPQPISLDDRSMIGAYAANISGAAFAAQQMRNRLSAHAPAEQWGAPSRSAAAPGHRFGVAGQWTSRWEALRAPRRLGSGSRSMDQET